MQLSKIIFALGTLTLSAQARSEIGFFCYTNPPMELSFRINDDSNSDQPSMSYLLSASGNTEQFQIAGCEAESMSKVSMTRKDLVIECANDGAAGSLVAVNPRPRSDWRLYTGTLTLPMGTIPGFSQSTFNVTCSKD